MVQDRFGRDQHEALIRQLFHIKRFSELVDRLAAYDLSETPLYFTMRFVDGLR
jgi:hypothetical protein